MTNKNNKPRNSASAQKAWSPRPEKAPVKKSGKAKFVGSMQKAAKGWYTKVEVPTLASGLTYTENGAIAHASTGSALVDINFQITAMRGMDEKAIVTKWRKAYTENPRLALRWLGWILDIRMGQGERRLSKIIITDMMDNGGEAIVCELIKLIPEYGRFDMLYNYTSNPVVGKAVANLIRTQWKQDMANMKDGKSISLMPKWLSSANSRNANTRKEGLWTAKTLKLTERQYRKGLTDLRKYLDIVERKMSSDNWQAIDYEKVPSKANLIYKNAFLKHDEERRKAYLEALTSGDAKINSSVAYPHEIVYKYSKDMWNYRPTQVDPTIEGMWKALPDLVNEDASTLVVADGSGSMCSRIAGSSASALMVASALAIYFGERAKGPYANTYITFSQTPQFVSWKETDSLKSKLCEAYRHCECANTNIEAVFNLILDTAVRTNAKQEDLPKNLLIISDMQFDYMCNAGRNSSGWGSKKVTKTLMDSLADKFKANGYTIPNLIFWCVTGGTGRAENYPIKEDDRGIMVSGFSVNTLKMVMSGKMDPYGALVEVLMDKRYAPFEAALKK